MAEAHGGHGHESKADHGSKGGGGMGEALLDMVDFIRAVNKNEIIDATATLPAEAAQAFTDIAEVASNMGKPIGAKKKSHDVH